MSIYKQEGIVDLSFHDVNVFIPIDLKNKVTTAHGPNGHGHKQDFDSSL